jgi:hypothetical protein
MMSFLRNSRAFSGIGGKTQPAFRATVVVTAADVGQAARAFGRRAPVTLGEGQGAKP